MQRRGSAFSCQDKNANADSIRRTFREIDGDGTPSTRVPERATDAHASVRSRRKSPSHNGKFGDPRDNSHYSAIEQKVMIRAQDKNIPHDIWTAMRCSQRFEVVCLCIRFVHRKNQRLTTNLTYISITPFDFVGQESVPKPYSAKYGPHPGRKLASRRQNGIFSSQFLVGQVDSVVALSRERQEAVVVTKSLEDLSHLLANPSISREEGPEAFRVLIDFGEGEVARAFAVDDFQDACGNGLLPRPIRHDVCLSTGFDRDRTRKIDF